MIRHRDGLSLPLRSGDTSARFPRFPVGREAPRQANACDRIAQAPLLVRIGSIGLMEALFVALMRTGLSVLASLHERWRNVRVTVHRGYLQGDSREQFFITVTNLSPKREVEVTRVWFAVTPTVEAMAKPLPQRLKPDDRGRRTSRSRRCQCWKYRTRRFVRVPVCRVATRFGHVQPKTRHLTVTFPAPRIGSNAGRFRLPGPRCLDRVELDV